MTRIATGRTRPDPVAAELRAWIERLEAALAPLVAGDGSGIPPVDHLARTVRQGWAIYDRLPEDPRGEQLIVLLQRANAVMAAAEEVLAASASATGSR
jgi:hypothetical protein